ncbi:CPBP family intramembrane glutamic endopeptidase [Streptococcus suis]|uniref:Membrane protein n=1 Tax=Streptococcus suis R61 TaxID=996306 RepID=A0AA87F607_STRSU|nr:type II CAAX endopeptidase family protein [Streptococcus suis]EHC01598.1 putative membrane protein [Streptococcus suis R61]HEL2049151.1 CPBP family intramembrane metalloprotease [Streptococcus suis]HEM2582142.1 CPBP family intramembrane metalloprotease [Streptococcus suis]HEP1781005.1 CPBP family intramembrane metalloprotease [Streptococcus suis]HEP1840296.1 CPBP family intramembrane metalloprotease [Streptococcus suis]
MNRNKWKENITNPYVPLVILLGIYPYGLNLLETELQFYLGVVFIAIFSCVLLRQQGFGEILRFRCFSWKTVGVVILGFLALIAWAMVVHELFPKPANELAINEKQYLGVELLLFNIYVTILGPIGEELVFRGLVMKNFEKLFHSYLGVIVSASLFSLGHVLLFGWLVTDFIIYFGMGAIYALVFKKSKTIYPAICLHILWNSFIQLIVQG